MKKRMIPAAMMAAAAVLGGLTSSPSGQQVINQAAQAEQQIEQKTQTNRAVNQGQQAAQRTPGKTVSNTVTNPYIPTGGNYGGFVDAGVPPKVHGEYLLRTGKNKYNARKAKHFAKMRS